MAIYHYTDLNGLKGIVESNTLWATNIYFLNDREEFYHGYKCFLKALDYIDDKHCIDDVREHVRDMLDHFIKNQGQHIYSISFCSIADQLSQWRGYGRQQGVCIEFDEYELSEVFKHHNYNINNDNVIYTQENSTVEARDELNRLIGLNGPGSPMMGADILDKSIFIQFLMKSYIPFFKNVGFSEEKEYRFIFTARNETPDVHFRVTGSGYVPYIVLSPRDNIKLPIRKIIIGPSGNVEEVQSGIRFLLDHKGYKNVVIDRSKIPYRT